MMKRTKWIAAVLAFGAVTASVPGVAAAQDGVPPKPTVGDGLPPKPEDRVLISPEKLFAAPATLGDAWATALRAVLDSMKQSVDAERHAAQKTVAAERRTTAAWTTPAAPARRRAPAHAAVRLEPLPIEPVTYSNADPKGESGVLLGVAIELPWRVP